MPKAFMAARDTHTPRTAAIGVRCPPIVHDPPPFAPGADSLRGATPDMLMGKGCGLGTCFVRAYRGQMTAACVVI
jgi:hypothetical protein